jgi:hypothetical protein
LAHQRLGLRHILCGVFAAGHLGGGQGNHAHEHSLQNGRDSWRPSGGKSALIMADRETLPQR